MFGPPGTGKTLCARAVANRTDACFIRVIGSELVQKYVGRGVWSTLRAADSYYVTSILDVCIQICCLGFVVVVLIFAKIYMMLCSSGSKNGS